MSSKPPLLWHSNSPTVPTGYGAQTALFAERLKEHYGLTISAFYGIEGSMIPWGGIPLLPGMGATYGNETILEHAKATFGDEEGLVVTLLDAWVLDPNVWKQLRVASWVPVDHDPCPERVTSFLQGSGAVPIAMSKFGQRMLEETGLDPLYVPHAVDTKIYRQVGRVKARKAIGFAPDPFIVGMVAANVGNPSRKCFAEAFEAFKLFHAKHKDSRLYLHTEATGRFGGVDLPALIRRLGLDPDAVIFCDQYRAVHLPQPPDVMANVYSSFDVLLSPSAGEGFGIPVIEAQACFPAGTEVAVEDVVDASERPYTGEMVKIKTKSSTIEATIDHPIWTDEGWRVVGEIHPGTRVLYCPDAETSHAIHRGRIEDVVRALRPDAASPSGRGDGADLRVGPLAEAPAGAKQALLGNRLTETGHALRDRLGLHRRLDRRGGHGLDPAYAEGRRATSGQMEAPHSHLQHLFPTHGVAGRANYHSLYVHRTSTQPRQDALVPVPHSGPVLRAAVRGADSPPRHQARADAANSRVVSNPAGAGPSRGAIRPTARDHRAYPGAQYETVETVERREVRDLPVFNFTTLSGEYVAAGLRVHNCGVPVIVSDFSAQPELVGAGWLVDGVRTYTAIGSWQVKPLVPDIVDALESAYESREDEAFAVKARDKALQYDIDKVMEEFMLPALSEAWRRLTDAPVELKAAA